MAKAVKAVGTAIMIVGAVVATGGMALAMGAGVGLLGSASLATSAVLSVGSFSVSAGALLSVGSLVSSIGGSLSQPKVSSAGGALGWVGDPNGPLHFAAGRIAVGGDLRHKAAYGPNDRMYFSAVTVVSDAGPIDAFESFTANDIAVTFDASGKANSSYYANVMWRRTQLGFQPEGSYLASPSGLQGGASLPNWGASHKLSGKAAFILTLSENSKQSAYKGQYPKPRTIIRGLRVYDWRRDSTYPGGSGPQRLNDTSTWAYSANPILWSVKWLLGLWEGPNGKGAPQVDYQVGGIGARWENIDVAAFTEAANIADTHGWTCAAWPSTDDDKAQVLDAFLQAGGAYYIERAGKASCIHRAAPRVSVATITAADTAGPIELDTSASYLDRKNTGVATYLSEADGWKMTALPEVSSSQWVTEDGGRKRSVPVTYSYVDKAKQAAELMCLALAHTREGISGRIPLKSYMQGIVPGSAFTITEPEFVLNGLKGLCLEANYDAMTGVHTVTFVSETDAKYPYAFGQTPNPPPPPALTPVDPTHVSPPLPGDWTITPRPPAPGGGQLPGFDLGGIVSNETATAVIVEYGPTATGPWKQAYQGPPTVTTIPIDGLQPGATYYIAVRYQRDQNYSERYVYGPYTAPLLDPSPTAPTIVAMQDAIDLASDGIEALDNAVGTLNATVYTAGTGLLARTDAMFDTLNTPTTGVLARLTTVENKQTSDNSAAVNRLNALEATVNTPSTGLVARMATQESATVNLQTGKADVSRVAALEATVNTPGTGLSARMGAAETAVTNLQTQKASVERVATLEAFATSAVSPVPFDAAGAENFYTEAIEGGAAAPPSRIVAVAGEGKVFELQLVYLSTLGGAVLSDSGAYRVRARVRRTEDPAAGDRRVTLYLAAFDRAEQYLGALSSVVESDLTIGMGWREVASQLWKTEAVRTAFPAAHTVRPVVRGGSTISPSGNGTIQAKYLNLDAQGDTSVLAGRVTTLETAAADLQAGKADATRVAALEATVNTPGSGLIGKVGSLEAATADLQAQKADATRVEVLEATALGARPTTINDAAGTFFSQGGAGTAPLGNAKVGQDASGYYFKSSDTGAWIARGLVPIASGQVITVTGVWDQEVSGDSARITAWAFDAAGTMTAVTGPVTMFPVGAGNRITRSFGLAGAGAETTLPAGTVAARFGLQPNRTSAGSVRGRSLTIADGTLASTLNARVGTLETATANLQTGKADAARVTSLEATVNTPGTGLTARLTTVESVAASADGTAKAIKGVVQDVNGYVSGFASTNDGTTSSFEVHAAAFAIRDPSAGERTEYRAGNWYVYSPSENTRTRYGKAFGGTQKLVWWTGPSSVAEGSETKANAYVYMSQNTVSGPRFGGSDIVGGSGVLTATASSLIVQGGRNGAGGVSTSTTTVTTAGGNSGASMRWVKVSGDDLVANSPSSFTTSFYGTVGTGQSKSAVFMGVVTKAGQQAAVYVQADIADNGT